MTVIKPYKNKEVYDLLLKFSRNAFRLSLGSALPLVFMLCGVSAAEEAVPKDVDFSMDELGEQTFYARCMHCHAELGGAEPFEILTPREIYSSLRHGVMQEMAYGLDDGTLHAVANFLGDPQAAQKRPSEGGVMYCSDRSSGRDFEAVSGEWPGWSPDPHNTRSLNRAFSAADVQKIELKWTFVFPHTQYWNGAGNPVAVANGRLFVGNPNKSVYALDADTGCAHWRFEADGRLRAGVVVSNGKVVFGDLLGVVYALDARTGDLIWRHKVEEQATARITGTVAVHDGRVFVPVSALQESLTAHPDLSCCTARGSVVALSLDSGKQLWQTYMIEEPLEYIGKTSDGANRFGPSGLAVWLTPTVDEKRSLVYVGTGNQYTEPVVKGADSVVALDVKSGKKRWLVSLAPEETGGKDVWTMGCMTERYPDRERCSPEYVEGKPYDVDVSAPIMLVERQDGKEMLVAGTEGAMVYALDPDAEGKILWKQRVGKGSGVGGIEYGMATDGIYAFAPIMDPAESESDSHANGALVAVDLMSGEIAWRTAMEKDSCENKELPCANSQSTPPLVVGDIVVSGGLDGLLQIFDRTTGDILWKYDSVKKYQGVNGLQGKGGSFSMGGAVIADDKLYIVSGAGFFGLGLPGNVLLAFDLPQPKN